MQAWFVLGCLCQTELQALTDFTKSQCLPSQLTHAKTSLTWLLMFAGGYFFGCVPDGKAVMQTLQPNFPSYKGPLLHILAEWKGTPQPFGSAYSMAIGDTVTQGTIPIARTARKAFIVNVALGQMHLDLTLSCLAEPC